MESNERLEQQMAFILECDKTKNIFRQTYLADGSRKENDGEHAWHLALMAMLLCEHANEKVDVLRVMQMVIVHDLVEIDAGDTYAYDSAGNETKAKREQKAADRIFAILPKDQENFIRGLWEEFEAGQTPEAKFANALDKCQPMLLNDASGGKSWTEHDVCAAQVIERNKKTPEGSKRIWEYQKEIIAKNVREGKLRGDVK